MSVNVSNHLNFRGDTRDALRFYQSVFGGALTVVSYRDAHAVQDPAEADQVLRGQVLADNGFAVMGYDVPSSQPWERGTNRFFVSVRGDDDDEISAFWDKLGEGGTVVQPLGASGWARLYGMVRDRFGVVWVLDVPAPYVGS